MQALSRIIPDNFSKTGFPRLPKGIRCAYARFARSGIPPAETLRLLCCEAAFYGKLPRMENLEAFEKNGLRPVEMIGSSERHEIWKADAPACGGAAVVHVLLPQFSQEAREIFFAPAAAFDSLGAPAFAPAETVIDTPELKAIVARLPAGPMFDRAIANSGPLPFRHVVWIAISLAKSLKALFDSRGMVHGAIMPELAVADGKSGVRLLSPCFARKANERNLKADIADYGAFVMLAASGAPAGEPPKGAVPPAILNFVRRTKPDEPDAFKSWDDVLAALAPMDMGGGAGPAPCPAQEESEQPSDPPAGGLSAERIKALAGRRGPGLIPVVAQIAVAAGIICAVLYLKVRSAKPAPAGGHGGVPAAADGENGAPPDGGRPSPAAAANAGGRNADGKIQAPHAVRAPAATAGLPAPAPDTSPVRSPQPTAGGQTAAVRRSAPAAADPEPSSLRQTENADAAHEAYLSTNDGRKVPFIHKGERREVWITGLDDNAVEISLTSDGARYYRLRRGEIGPEQKKLWK